MLRFSLLEALVLIACFNQVLVEDITAISYEDGSGMKFVYSLGGFQYYCSIGHEGQITNNKQIKRETAN